MKLEIIILFYLIFFISCGSKEKNRVMVFNEDKTINGNDTFEVLKSYYDNGVPFEIKNLKNGLLHGIQTRFDQTGKIDFTKSYYNGNPYGPYKEFYKGGTKIMRFEYIVDSIHSTFIRNYDENGKLIKEEGSPLVNYNIYSAGITGIVNGKFQLCNFESKHLKFEIAEEGSPYVELKNGKPSEVDLTSEFDFSKKVKKVKVFVKITCVDFNSVSKTYFDTLFPIKE